MSQDELAKVYASSLAELAFEKGIQSEVERQLNLVIEMLDESTELDRVLRHPAIDVSIKIGLIKRIFSELDALLLNFLILLVKKRRWNYLPYISRAFADISLDLKGIVRVELEVANAIDIAWKKELEKVLHSKLQKQIQLVVKENPDLIGGVRIKVKNKVYDGSLQAGLSSLRKQLLTT